jgi:hypothetical protein
MNDQYPRSPRQTIRMTRTTSSSFNVLSLRDRSSSSTAAGPLTGVLSQACLPAIF